MYRKILTVLLILVLFANLPLTAFALETTGTETTAATEAASAAAEPSTQQPQTESEPTQPSQASEPTQPAETEPTTASEPPVQPSEPSQSKEPSQSTEPSQPSTPTTPSTIPTFLEIDTEHIYSGMDEAYEDGYTPRISGDTMHLVLPLLTNGKLYKDEIKVSLGLGGSSSAPFVMANYEKVFELEWVKPKNSEIKQEVFLVKFDVALSSSRINGVYPVTVNISGYDDSNNAISSIYTIYVTITDGKSTTVTPYLYRNRHGGARDLHFQYCCRTGNSHGRGRIHCDCDLKKLADHKIRQEYAGESGHGECTHQSSGR